MLNGLANAAIRHPRRLALLALTVFMIAGVFGAATESLLNARNPFSDLSSASARAEAMVQQATGNETSPGVVALVQAPPGLRDDLLVADYISHAGILPASAVECSRIGQDLPFA